MPIAKYKENKNTNDITAKLWGLTNVFRPLGKIQDYSHEREWRIFGDFSLQDHLRAVIAPDRYVSDIRVSESETTQWEDGDGDSSRRFNIRYTACRRIHIQR